VRRRIPWWLLLVAFIAVPLVEIYVIIQVGQVIGAWWTILLLIADSIFGSWLIRREGGKAFQALQVALREGRMPGRELADGVLILVGGTLMLSPGFVTDIFGVICILPFTRPLGRRLLSRFLMRRLVAGPGGAGAQKSDQKSDQKGDQRGGQERQRPGSTEVIQGEVVD
jgi:UPF0716 protein FxsA